MDATPCGEGPHPVSDAVSSACSGLGGGLLTCYSPFRHWAPKGPVRLACLIHAASVHSEPGSNSPSLKSPMRRRSAPPPVDSIKIIKGFFSGRSPREKSRGNHSIFKKNHVRSYCAARFPKSRRPDRRFRHAHYFTPPSRFCKRRRRIFSRKSNIKLSYAGNPIFRKSSFHSHFERNSMNSSDCLLLQMVAHPIES